MPLPSANQGIVSQFAWPVVKEHSVTNVCLSPQVGRQLYRGINGCKCASGIGQENILAA